MKEYGYMEGQYLRSIFIAEKVQKYRDKDGILRTRTQTIEEQVRLLPPLWKPVDAIDDSKLEVKEDGYIIIPIPYDCGDHIGYRYVKKLDLQRVRDEIRQLKDNLARSDYKITKCYESSLIGEPLPYNIEELHEERQAQREKIKELEAMI